MESESRYIAQLSASTAELIERYADCDEEGYITNFQIINEELIGVLLGAAEWLKKGFASNEHLCEVWERENPCESCHEREGCTITCRRKHTFDKEVYGGLLCGKNPAAYQVKWGGRGAKNKVHFKARLYPENRLSFERDIPHLSGAVWVDKKGGVRIEAKRIKLRPWSAALYTIFALHPEGIVLSSIAKERRREFIKIYTSITKSDVKTEKLLLQLDDSKHLSHLLNNKLSELNKQLAAEGVEPRYRICSAQHKSNNKPYFIPYLRG